MKRVLIVLFLSVFLISCNFDFGIGQTPNPPDTSDNPNNQLTDSSNPFEKMHKIASSQEFTGTYDDWMQGLMQNNEDKNISLKLVDNVIYWSYSNIDNYLPLFDLNEIFTTSSESNIEFKYSGNYLMWKYKDQSQWYELLQLFENIITYTITYVDGLTSEVINKITVEEESILNEPADPEKVGYTFVGWEYNGKLFDFNTKITQDITLIAVFENDVYQVQFNDEYGNHIYSPVNVNYGKYLDKPANPEKVGYTFVGWEYNGKLFDFNIEITEDVELIAKWNQIIIDERLQKFALEIVDLFNDVVIENKMETTQSDFINTTHPNIKEVFSNLENLSKYKWFLEYILDEMTEEVTEKNLLDDTYYVETKELLEKLIAFDVNAINEMYPNGRTALRNFIHHLVNAENPLMEPSRNVYDFMCVDYKNHPEKLAEFLDLYENHKEDFKDLIIIIDDTECFVNTKIGWNAAPYPSLENFEIVYSVSDESLATIDDSYITLLNPGTVVISFYLKDYDIIKKLTIEIIEEESSDYKTINYDYNGGYPAKYGYETDKDKVIYNLLIDLYNHFLEQGAFQHKVINNILVEDSSLITPTFEEFSSNEYWRTNFAVYAETILNYYLFTPYCEENGTINENYRDYIEGSEKFFNTKVGQYWLPLADWVNEAVQYNNGAGQDFWARKGLTYVSYDLLAKQSYYENDTMYKDHSFVLSTTRGTLLGSYRFAQYIAGTIYAQPYKNYIPSPVHQQVIHSIDDQLITPERDGYDFLGWSLEPNSSNYITSISEITLGNVTLYANWKLSDNYRTVEFINDGEVVASYFEPIGTLIEIPNLIKYGYKFMGWSTSIDGEVIEDVSIVNENITYYAVWQELSGFDVTYVDPNYQGTESNYFTTITDALNNTKEGGIIFLTEGTYDSEFVISKNNITISGPNAGVNAAKSERDLEAVLSGKITIATGVVGAKIDGCHLKGFGAVTLEADVNGFILQYCVLEGIAQDGVVRGPSEGEVKNIKMKYNYSSAYNSYRFAYFAAVINGLEMIGNELTCTGSYDFLNVGGTLKGTVVIKDNTFVKSLQSFVYVLNVGVLDCTISGNKVSEIANTFIDLRKMKEDGAVKVDIYDNEFKDSSIRWMPIRVRTAGYDANDSIVVNVYDNIFNEAFTPDDDGINYYINNPSYDAQVDPFKAIYVVGKNLFIENGEVILDVNNTQFLNAAISFEAPYESLEEYESFKNNNRVNIQMFADEMVNLFNHAVIDNKMETTQSGFIGTTHPNIKGVFNNLETLVKYQWLLEYILDEMTEEVTEKNLLDDTYYVETKELLEKLIAFDVNAINGMYPNGRTALRNFIHHLVNAENPLMEPSRDVYDFMCVDYKNHPEKLAEFLELYQNNASF